MSKEREDESWGDSPPGDVPGEIRIDDVANPAGLRKKAYEFLKRKRDILKGAKKAGHEIIATASCNGRVMIVGVRVIGAAGVVAAGALVIYPRWKARQQRLSTKK